MQSKSLIKTTVIQKSQKIDIDQSQCPSEKEINILQPNQRSKSEVIQPLRIQPNNLLIQNFKIVKHRAAIVRPRKRILKTKVNGSGFQFCRKLKKNKKKKNASDYRKNICGYITKKVIREFTSQTYQLRVRQLCYIFGCDYNGAKLYYSGKIQHVTGPSHIPGLLITEGVEDYRYKLAFQSFFIWFLRERYLRYLLIEGKMADKKAYIQYKNQTLISLIQSKKIQPPVKMQQMQYYHQMALFNQYMHKEQQQPFKHTIIHIPIVKRVDAVKQQQV